MPIQLADVVYHGTKVGVVFWDAPRRTAVFEYTPEFVAARRAGPESVNENGDENGKRVGESSYRPPFSSADATVPFSNYA